MRNFLVSTLKALIKALYRLFGVFSRRNEVLFVSRQSNDIPYDFNALSTRFHELGFSSVFLIKKLSASTFISYAWYSFRKIYHLARCKVCILDGYDPVVSMIDFKYEETSSEQDRLHFEFPIEPIIVQIWHALGAYKRFGFQSLGTAEGRSRESAQRLSMHRNYSWILCTGESSRFAFAEAFSYPIERVRPLGRPEVDLLRNISRIERPAGECCFLFAPTLRRSDDSAHPFRELSFLQNDLFHDIDAEFIWSFHPVEEQTDMNGVNDLLMDCDYVITDYSSIAYEAYLLGKGVVFYVSDIEQYSQSPGLNIDPTIVSPRISFKDPYKLSAYLKQLSQDPSVYCEDDLMSFVQDTFSSLAHEDVTGSITDFIIGKLGHS